MYYKPGSDLEIDYISGFVYDRRKYLEIALFFRSMLCLAGRIRPSPLVFGEELEPGMDITSPFQGHCRVYLQRENV